MADSSNPETRSSQGESAPPTGHRITLRGPWSIHLRASGDSPAVSSTARVTLPGPWTLGDLPAETIAVYTRWFNAPVNPPVGEQLWLLFPGVGGSGEVRLNGVSVGRLDEATPDRPSVTSAFRIETLLKPRNELEVRLLPAGPLSKRGLYGAAVLEFRPE